MILRLAVALALLLTFMMPLERAYGDSLSISAWQTGDSLNATNLGSRMNSITTWANGNIANDNLKSSAGVVGSKLDLTSGTGRLSNSTSVTSDAPIITSAQTWNNAVAAFSGWRLNIVNTNSASTSRLIDLQVDSTVIASISRTGQLVLNSQAYASGPRTLMDGAWFNIASATYTDNITAASGTAPRFIAYSFQRPAIAAANSSVTTTHAATVFIASAPVTSTNMTLTNRYALWVDQGDVRIGGNVFASGTMTITGALAIPGGITGNVGIGATSTVRLGITSDTSQAPQLDITSADFGDGAAGAAIIVGRNSNGTNTGAASIDLINKNGTAGYIWQDTTSVLRINTSAPTSLNDTAGTVVGSQTSWHAFKNVLRLTQISPDAALAALMAVPIYDFQFKEPSFKGPQGESPIFTGLVGYQRTDWFLTNTAPNQQPALNEISLFGYTIQAIKALERRLAIQEAK